MKSAFSRKTRDRRGGHEPKMLGGDAGICGFTPVERAFIKREGKRAIRRQHRKATEQGLRDYEQDIMDVRIGYWGMFGIPIDTCSEYDDYPSHYADEYMDDEDDCYPHHLDNGHYDAMLDERMNEWLDDYMRESFWHEGTRHKRGMYPGQEHDERNQSLRVPTEDVLENDLIVERRHLGRPLGELLKEYLGRQGFNS